jgi:hypothetical protein
MVQKRVARGVDVSECLKVSLAMFLVLRSGTARNFFADVHSVLRLGASRNIDTAYLYETYCGRG